MDTSNSKKIKLGKYIIGEESYSHSDLKHNDWCEVLSYILELVRPRLKYLSGYKSLTEFIRFDFSHGDSKDSPKFIFNADDKVINSGGIDLTYRMLGICYLPKKKESNHLFQHLHVLVCDMRGLFYTIGGEYIRSSSSENPKRYEAKFINVQAVDLGGLMLTENMRGDRTLGGLIVDSIFKIVLDTIEEKRLRLESLEDVLNPLSSIRDRLQSSSTPVVLIERI